MIDLESLSKEELIALIGAMNNKDGEKPFHPDSMMAMAMASPKEARAISWRMMHPVAKFFVCLIPLLFVVVIFYVLFLFTVR